MPFSQSINKNNRKIRLFQKDYSVERIEKVKFSLHDTEDFLYVIHNDLADTNKGKDVINYFNSLYQA